MTLNLVIEKEVVNQSFDDDDGRWTRLLQSLELPRQAWRQRARGERLPRGVHVRLCDRAVVSLRGRERQPVTQPSPLWQSSVRRFELDRFRSGRQTAGQCRDQRNHTVVLRCRGPRAAKGGHRCTRSPTKMVVGGTRIGGRRCLVRSARRPFGHARARTFLIAHRRTL